MCGIAGAARFREQVDSCAVEGMVSGLRHRGPDASGTWVSPGKTCSLGHTRLSVIDLSQLAHQPMVDPHTGNAITFNGEIYNFQALRRDCEVAGEHFISQSDTEVILALYRRHGVDCLQQLRGMFALAIWDNIEQKLVLARDRVGKKPLNYALCEGGIAFCSSLRPLSRHPGIDARLDPEALELYLQCQFIPAPWTIYRGLRKLLPAHYAVFDRTGLKTARYWSLDYRNKVTLSETDALDALEEKLTEATRLRMISDVPLGALLSGGVDSSVVVALMAKLSAKPIRTFSIGFEEEAFNELPWAAQAASRCNTAHHPEIVSGEVQSLLSTIARHHGEPYADSSAVPSFLVSAAARRHVTVALNGDGGDELLGGYPRYWLTTPTQVVSAVMGRWLPPGRLALLAPRLAAAQGVPRRLLRKLLTQYVSPELRSVNMFSAFWNDLERRELFPDGPAHVLPDWRVDWLQQAFEHARNPVDRMLWLDNHTYLPGDLLVKMDVASMHCGLETRSPLLDHRLIEFCAALPSNYKVRRGVGKYLLKRLASRYFPAAFVHRRKMGFGIPLAQWLRGPLNTSLREVVLDSDLMAPLSMASIARTLSAFDAGQGGHESRLWALLMFGTWRASQSRSDAIVSYQSTANNQGVFREYGVSCSTTR